MKVVSFIFFSLGVVATATATNTAGSTTTVVGGHRRTGGIAASLSDSKEDEDDDDDDATTASIMSRTNVGILATLEYEGGTCEDEKFIDITDDDDQYDDGVGMKDNITIGVVEYGSFCIESIPMSDDATTDTDTENETETDTENEIEAETEAAAHDNSDGHHSHSQSDGDHAITISAWHVPYTGPTAVVASVGDTIAFEWDTGHNVFLHPTMDCTREGAIYVGDTSPTTYTFTEADGSAEGTEMFFSCDSGKGTHCKAGQFLIATVFSGPRDSDSDDGHDDETSGTIGVVVVDATSYVKVMYDCTWEGVQKTYHTCSDTVCSPNSCTPSAPGGTSSSATPWTNYYPTSMQSKRRSDDYCYHTTNYANNNNNNNKDDDDKDDETGLTSAAIQVSSWKELSNDDDDDGHEVMARILFDNSCISAWADDFDDQGVHIVDDTGDDDIPKDAVVCEPGANGRFAFCDCHSDCLNYPKSACGCPEAQDCCSANVKEYDVDRNSVPDQYIQCPTANDVCDCSNDCYINQQQCQCEEAQACCHADVKCPDSDDPAEHCDCGGDCTNHPDYCTCEEAQKCCADYAAAAADENDDLEAEGGTTDYSDDVDGDDDDDNDDDGNCQTIEEILCVMGVEDFSVLCSLYTQYVPEPLGTPMTLFAPIDSAFEELTDLFGRDITTDPSDLTERIFFFHAMDQPLLYEELECKKLYTMLSGDMSRTTCKKADVTRLKEKFQKGGGNRKNDSLPKIFDADLVACDGSIIHTIDSVMLPNFIMEWTK